MKKAIVLWNKNVENKYSMSEEPLEGFVFFTQKDQKSAVKIDVYLKGLKTGLMGFIFTKKQ